MKRKFKAASLLLVTSLLSLAANAQQGLKDALQGEWIKDEVTLEDGSPVYDLSVTRSSFLLDFRHDSLIVSLDGINSVQRYRIADSTISYRNQHYKVARLDHPILELVQVNQPEDVEPLTIKFLYKPIYDLSTTPQTYLAKNEDLVYIYQPDVVEPKFIHPNMSAMTKIFSDFRFPEYKKGGFVVRFVITEDGKMEGLRMVASSDTKFDNRLIAAVKKTKGKWLPAKYQGENVNCEVEYNFDLGYTKVNNTPPADENKKIVAEEYLSYGKYYFGEKVYKSSIYYLDKAIDNDPYLIEAYYLRAAANIYRKNTNGACKDYHQLKILDQQKAFTLYDTYCEDYTPETTN
ncbi:energy transducer TonB [Jiulongibacter sp. NS-SX5]|uniref:energy transducer TonB n=1 Tax=Jiulongibacter sp. NS-SX5 TaxID=3463854 RepID=UPI0040586B33